MADKQKILRRAIAQGKAEAQLKGAWKRAEAWSPTSRETGKRIVGSMESDIKEMGKSRANLAEANRESRNLMKKGFQKNAKIDDKAANIAKSLRIKSRIKNVRKGLAEHLRTIRNWDGGSNLLHGGRKAQKKVARVINKNSKRLGDLANRVRKFKGVFPKSLGKMGNPAFAYMPSDLLDRMRKKAQKKGFIRGKRKPSS